MGGREELTERVRATIEKYHMIARGDGVIAGVSGGADSVCLLAVLREYRKECPFSLTVVHVEHGIRGAASLADAAFVEDLCEQWQIPCYVEHVDVQRRAEQNGVTLEEAGRQARYEIFEAYRDRLGASRIAVAHNQNDQAETVLLNLARGSGLKGLGGIRPVRGTVIRPLLFLSRGEIEEWLESQGLSYCTDLTNLEPDYTRNILRLEILPQLEREVNREAIRHMAQGAEHLQKAEDYIRHQAEACYREWVREKAGFENLKKAEFENPKEAEFQKRELRIDRRALLAAPELMQEYVLRMCVEEILHHRGLKDYTMVHIEQMKRLAGMDCGKRMDFPGGLQAVRQREELVLFAESGSGEKAVPERRKMAEASGEKAVPEWRKIAGVPGEKAMPEWRKIAGVLGEKVMPGQRKLAGAQGEKAVPGQRKTAGAPGVCVPLPADGWYEALGRKFCVEYQDDGENMQGFPEKTYTKWLAYDTIKDNVCLRTRQTGDYLVINQEGGRKKLKDYLIDQKVPREERDQVLLVAEGSHILWVVGQRISEDAKITGSTGKRLKIQMIMEEEA